MYPAAAAAGFLASPADIVAAVAIAVYVQPGEENANYAWEGCGNLVSLDPQRPSDLTQLSQCTRNASKWTIEIQRNEQAF